MENVNNTQSFSELERMVPRITFGAVLLTFGLLKLITFTLPGVVDFFESIGFPGLIAYAAIFLEVGFGVALMFGLLPRITAKIAIPILVGTTCFAMVTIGFLVYQTSAGNLPMYW